MKAGLVGFLIGFASAWGLHELAYRIWRRRVIARTEAQLDAAEIRIERAERDSPEQTERDSDE